MHARAFVLRSMPTSTRCIKIVRLNRYVYRKQLYRKRRQNNRYSVVPRCTYRTTEGYLRTGRKAYRSFHQRHGNFTPTTKRTPILPLSAKPNGTRVPATICVAKSTETASKVQPKLLRCLLLHLATAKQHGTRRIKAHGKNQDGLHGP